MKKILVWAIIILVLGAGVLYLANNSKGSTGSVVDESILTGETKTFVMTGENFKFVLDGVDNPELKVNKGDVVRIEFTSTDGFHDWVVDEFGATKKVMPEDGMTFVEFVASEKGEFEYYCSVGQHRANGMKGVFIVE